MSPLVTPALTMTNEITSMESPTHFVDQQVRGPFGRFHHEHRFVSSEGFTEMIDAIEFCSPFGVLGRVVDRIVIERYLTNLIRVRNQHFKAAAELLTASDRC